MHLYRISGLSVGSEIELSGAVPASEGSGPDILVRRGMVPQALPAPQSSGPAWQRDGDDFLLRIPQVARLLISKGQTITVDIDPASTARDASVFVLGSGIGIALHQRNMLALHGSCVARDGKAMILCGASGQGKSTTAAALCNRGFTLVADDISVITFDADGAPVVCPDGRQLKLWHGAVEGLGLADAAGAQVRHGIDKYFVAPRSAAADAPALSAIYHLKIVPSAAGPSIVNASLPDAMRMLDLQAYRPRLRQELSAPAVMLKQSAATLKHARACIFARPLGFDRLDGDLDTLIEHWQSA